MTYNRPTTCPRCRANIMPGSAFCSACGCNLAQTPQQLQYPPPSHKKVDNRNAGIGCLTIVVLFIAFSAAVRSCGNSPTASTTPDTGNPPAAVTTPSPGTGSTSSSGAVGVGETGYLRCEGEPTLLVAIDRAALDEFTKVSVAKDYYGLGQLIASGRLFEVPAGTRVLVIDSSVFSRKVRIMEGASAGQSGWLAYEFVSRN